MPGSLTLAPAMGRMASSTTTPAMWPRVLGGGATAAAAVPLLECTSSAPGCGCDCTRTSAGALGEPEQPARTAASTRTAAANATPRMGRHLQEAPYEERSRVGELGRSARAA